jgi:hypothetical protein
MVGSCPRLPGATVPRLGGAYKRFDVHCPVLVNSGSVHFLLLFRAAASLLETLVSSGEMEMSMHNRFEPDVNMFGPRRTARASVAFQTANAK